MAEQSHADHGGRGEPSLPITERREREEEAAEDRDAAQAGSLAATEQRTRAAEESADRGVPSLPTTERREREVEAEVDEQGARQDPRTLPGAERRAREVEQRED